jgi:hypothetical protein
MLNIEQVRCGTNLGDILSMANDSGPTVAKKGSKVRLQLGILVCCQGTPSKSLVTIMLFCCVSRFRRLGRKPSKMGKSKKKWFRTAEALAAEL